MKRNIRRIICILGAVMCLMMATMSASADTITFDVTYPYDPYSRTVKKADTEQRFYVTGTSFSRSGISLYCYSQQLRDGSITSYTATISSASPGTSAAYQKYAAPDLEYQMVTSSSLVGFNVLGRYTP